MVSASMVCSGNLTSELNSWPSEVIENRFNLVKAHRLNLRTIAGLRDITTKAHSPKMLGDAERNFATTVGLVRCLEVQTVSSTMRNNALICFFFWKGNITLSQMYY
jgi:hypothetical protein